MQAEGFAPVSTTNEQSLPANTEPLSVPGRLLPIAYCPLPVASRLGLASAEDRAQQPADHPHQAAVIGGGAGGAGGGGGAWWGGRGGRRQGCGLPLDEGGAAQVSHSRPGRDGVHRL